MARKTIKFTFIRSMIQKEEKEISFTKLIVNKMNNHIFIQGIPSKKPNTSIMISIPIKYGEITKYEIWNEEKPLKKKDGKSIENKDQNITTK